MNIIFTFMVSVLVILFFLWLYGERWRLIRPSTRQCLREMIPLSVLKIPHSYIYGRWTKQYFTLIGNYILPRLSESWKKRLSNTYHGKVLTLKHARAIITLNQDIPLCDLEQIIPYPVARNLLLTGSPEIIVYECPCRHARSNPCQPTQVCMIIGQPFVNFLLEHNPQSSRRVSQAEALQILKEEHNRGHLHSAWFRDIMFNRFYAICNCCKCCCFGIQAMTKHGIAMMTSSGYVAQLDDKLCIACGACIEICPFEALCFNNTTLIYDWKKCMGCGICSSKCPTGAIRQVRDERKGIPMDLRTLTQ